MYALYPRKRASKAAIAPIPAFTLMESPLAVDCGVGNGNDDDEGVGVAVETTRPVKFLGKVTIPIPFVQHALLSPQHQLVVSLMSLRQS